MENEITTEQLVNYAEETLVGIKNSLVNADYQKAFDLLNEYASMYSQRIIQQTQKALENKNQTL